MLAGVESSLEADKVRMLRTQRFATAHADIRRQRFTVFGITLTLPRRDAHGDLSIADHVAGEPCYSGRLPQDSQDSQDSADRAGASAS